MYEVLVQKRQKSKSQRAQRWAQMEHANCSQYLHSDPFAIWGPGVDPPPTIFRQTWHWRAVVQT
eukprot:CAMPEP_0172622776 /NCGR_PEP_ID=MMETSP1068-20121228/123391_1 /TAXON_ID=35684 /ORGANISM="Pseudopedinella elastica, Strain CCMP716" /LENGTH=63 /DNA_ID=CAMNT_0013431083 /DNA_START=304 /DNA_END=491 /DNA_ORIENTATION=+